MQGLGVTRMGQRSRILRLALLVTTAIGAAAPATAPATANDWTGTLGDWFSSGNWANGIPGAADTANISNGGTAQITSGTTATSGTAILGANSGDAGTVTIAGTGSHWENAGQLDLGKSGAGTLTVSTGGSISTGITFVADSAGSRGTISLKDAGTSWSNTDLFALGYNGAGTLSVLNGATMQGADSFLGYHATGEGTATVSGAGSRWTNSGNVFVGHGGAGTLTVAEGGVVSNAQIFIGDSDGSNGTVSVDGAGSALTNTGVLMVGNRGTATLNVANGGTVTGQFAFLGYSNVGNGTARLTGVGSNWANAITYVGYQGMGTLEISDGARVTDTYGYVGFNPTGEGTVTVSGAGSTWANVSALYVGVSGTGTVIVKDGGTISAGSLGITIAQQATSTGTVVIGGLENSAAEAAGILATDRIDFGPGNGKLVLNHTSTDYTLSAAITGSGSIIQKAGTTVLTGDGSAFAGTTTILGGKLVVGNGTSGALGGTINVGSGAILGGTGNLGATTIAAGGMHAPGNSIGTQTINGNYANHGTLVIEAGPAGADKVIVNGAVDITGARLDLQLAGAGWDLAQSPYVHTIIANDGVDAIAGTFDYSPASHLFLDTSLNYAGGDGNDVALTIARNGVSFASLAGNGAQAGVAQAIENLGSGELFDAIVALNDADLVRQSFDALSGQALGSTGSTLINNGKMMGQTANSRMQASTEPAGSGSAPVLAYGPGGPELVSPDTKLGVVWSSGFGARGSIEGSTKGSSLDTDNAGIAAGVDGQFGDWRLGALAGYSNSGFKATDGKVRGGSDNYSVGLYGGTEWGDVAFRSSLAYSWHDVSTRRSVSVGAFTDELSARYGAHSIQASGELSYNVNMGNAARLEPFANLTHVRIATDGYSETGGAAALTNAASVTNTTFTTLGIRAPQKFAVGTVLATVNAMVGWEHAMGDLTPQNTASFAGGSSFTVSGTAAPADAALVSTGLDLNINDATTIGITYDGRFAKGTYTNGVTAKVKVLF
jgi:outer membrane autotransporter protein